MTLEILRSTLGWCFIINSAFLIFWFVMFAVGRRQIHRMHNRMIPLSEERFNAIHYAGMAGFKTFIIAANLTPYLALRLVG